MSEAHTLNPISGSGPMAYQVIRDDVEVGAVGWVEDIGPWRVEEATGNGETKRICWVAVEEEAAKLFDRLDGFERGYEAAILSKRET
mgnify:CR=1 FL=1